MKKREKRRLWKIPAVLMFIMACILTIVYFSTGQIPVVNRSLVTDLSLIYSSQVKVILDYALPVEISRLWDVLFVGVFGFLLVKASYYTKNKPGSPQILIIIQIIVLIFSIVVFIIGLHSDVKQNIFSFFFLKFLSWSLIINFFASILGDREDFRQYLFFSAFMGLILGMFFSLKIGFLLGLLLAILIFIAFTLATTLGWLLKSLFMSLGLANDPEKEAAKRRLRIIYKKVS